MHWFHNIKLNYVGSLRKKSMNLNHTTDLFFSCVSVLYSCQNSLVWNVNPMSTCPYVRTVFVLVLKKKNKDTRASSRVRAGKGVFFPHVWNRAKKYDLSSTEHSRAERNKLNLNAIRGRRCGGGCECDRRSQWRRNSHPIQDVVGLVVALFSC